MWNPPLPGCKVNGKLLLPLMSLLSPSVARDDKYYEDSCERTGWFRGSYHNTCKPLMEKENDDYSLIPENIHTPAPMHGEWKFLGCGGEGAKGWTFTKGMRGAHEKNFSVERCGVKKAMKSRRGTRERGAGTLVRIFNKSAFRYTRSWYTLWLVDFDSFCQQWSVFDHSEKCDMAVMTDSTSRHAEFKLATNTALSDFPNVEAKHEEQRNCLKDVVG